MDKKKLAYDLALAYVTTTPDKMKLSYDDFVCEFKDAYKNYLADFYSGNFNCFDEIETEAGR